MSKKFWMVWREGGGIPTYKHESEESARTEAARLAGNVPCQRFHVLESIASVAAKVELQWHDMSGLEPVNDEGWYPWPLVKPQVAGEYQFQLHPYARGGAVMNGHYDPNNKYPWGTFSDGHTWSDSVKQWRYFP